MPAVRCTCMGNAIITFFTPFNPAPCDRNVAQNTRPSFRFLGEGSGDETRMQGGGWGCFIMSVPTIAPTIA